MDKIFLWLVGFISPLMQRAGVDTYQLYQILRIKLMMDERRPKAMFTARKAMNNGNTRVQSPWLVTVLTIFMGVFIGLVLFLNKMPYVGQTLYFLIFMVLMSITLISDFTSVLLDTRDQFIILPRPVSDRTFALSRILHISYYVLRLALLQGAAGIVIVGFTDGILAVPLFFLQLLQATFLSIFLVNIVYLLLMRSVSPQRFKDIISYFQIGFSVLIFGTYYLLPKLINISVLEKIDIINHWWAWPLPPVWIAALNELLIHGSRGGLLTIILAILGLVAPVIGLWLVIKVLAPGFNKRLAIIATSDGNSKPANATKKTQKFSLMDKIANLVAPDPIENAGFKITMKLASRSRDFKMKVYPAFAYVPIYFLYFVLSSKGSIADRLDKLQNGHNYILLPYLCSFILLSVLANVSMSEKYKSAWVYYAAPISEPGKILSGMYKAIIVGFFIPYCLIISVPIILIWGPQTINDIILASLVSTIYGMLVALFTVKGLPFSKPVIVKQGGGRMITSMIMLAFIGGVGFLHYISYKWETAIWIAIIPFFIINLVMFHYYKKQSWENIEMADDM
jgi:ABC-2 type transport system permease protein